MPISRQKLITVLISVIISLSTLATASAQTASSSSPGRGTAGVRKQGINQPAPGATAPPVTIVPKTTPPDYLFGQAQVSVRGNQDPVIRLGLAQHGPIVIEFPASDNFFAVHPGGSSIVTYDESPTLATDHYLVFRAGSGFAAGENSSGQPEARASISVQMQSGLFVTFLFYPVRDVGRMAHRCVVTYSRDEVVAARRAVGLAVNLDGKTPQFVPLPTASSKRVAGAGGGGEDTTLQQSVSAGVVLESGALTSGTSQGNTRPKKRSVDLRRESQKALKEALAAPSKFDRWSAPTQGLSISALAPIDLDSQRRMTVVAVKNTTQSGLRLVVGGPEIDLQTLNEGGQVVQVRSITRLHTEATGVGGAIPAGATIYYAVIYEAPVLDAAQRVRLSVAQDTAADRPASTELGGTN
jgi:hypothetical protein